MIPAISISIAVALVGLAVWGGVLFAAGRAPSRAFLIVAGVVAIELLLHAGAALIAVIGGHDTESLPQFLGYSLASVVLLPSALLAVSV